MQHRVAVQFWSTIHNINLAWLSERNVTPHEGPTTSQWAPVACGWRGWRNWRNPFRQFWYTSCMCWWTLKILKDLDFFIFLRFRQICLCSFGVHNLLGICCSDSETCCTSVRPARSSHWLAIQPMAPQVQVVESKSPKTWCILMRFHTCSSYVDYVVLMFVSKGLSMSLQHLLRCAEVETHQHFFCRLLLWSLPVGAANGKLLRTAEMGWECVHEHVED